MASIFFNNEFYLKFLEFLESCEIKSIKILHIYKQYYYFWKMIIACEHNSLN